MGTLFPRKIARAVAIASDFLSQGKIARLSGGKGKKRCGLSPASEKNRNRNRRKSRQLENSASVRYPTASLRHKVCKRERERDLGFEGASKRIHVKKVDDFDDTL